jgi:hypothetical protein
MKTPREILLEQHRSAAPKLDAIRNDVLNAERRSAEAHPNWLVLCWRELIWPSRRIWTGLAVAWVLILAANISLSEQSPAIVKSGPSSEMMMSLKDQQKILAELLNDHSVPRGADRQKIFSPKPRTECVENLTV